MNNKLITEFWKSFSESSITMISLEDSNNHAAPMHAHLDKEAHNQIWYVTSRSNGIAKGGRAMAQFMSKDHDLFACLSGTLVEETDVAFRKKIWSKEDENWFPMGPSDSNVVVLRFEIEDSEIWTVDLGVIGSFKLLVGMPIDKEEAGEHGVGKV